MEIKMILVRIFLIISSAMMETVFSQCDEVMNCDNYELLSQDNSIGLLALDQVDPLCSVIQQLNRCISRNSKNCEYIERVVWEPTLQAGLVICQNIGAYKDGTSCYFDGEVEEKIDICSDNLDMDCGSLLEYRKCIIRSATTVKNKCSENSVRLLSEIISASLSSHFVHYNCSIPGETTTAIATTAKSNTEKTTTSAPLTTSLSYTDNINGTDVTEGSKGKGNASFDKINLSLLVALLAVSNFINRKWM